MISAVIGMKKLLLVFAGIGISALILELGLRYYFYRWNSNQPVPFVLFARPFPDSDDIGRLIVPSADPRLLYELANSNISVFKGKPFVTNSDGVLGATEYSREKPTNTVRIVGVGDSVMSSWGVDPAATYLSVLEQSLAARFPGKNIQTINLSVPGYNTAMEEELIKTKALRYHPDLIILGYVINDVDLPNYVRTQVHAKSYLYYTAKRAVQMIASYAGRKRPDIRLMENAPMEPGDTHIAYTEERVPDQYKYMVGKKNFLLHMKEISDTARSAGVPVVLLFDYEGLNRYPEIRDYGFHLINMDEATRRYLKNPSITLDNLVQGNGDFHLSESGHRAYAGALFQYLTEDPELEKLFE